MKIDLPYTVHSVVLEPDAIVDDAIVIGKLVIELVNADESSGLTFRLDKTPDNFIAFRVGASVTLSIEA